MSAARETASTRTLLIVDDDVPFRTRLMQACRERGFEVSGAGSYEEAVAAASTESPELALVDLRLPGESGLEVVRALKDIDATTNVVVLTGYGSIATAVASMKLGATTYLTKPVDADQVCAAFESGRVAAPESAGVRRWPGSNGSTFTGARRLRRQRVARGPPARTASTVASAQAVEGPGAGDRVTVAAGPRRRHLKS
jgi:ActR/RegA family two-component response regulator